MLAQIRATDVHLQNLPTDEIVAAGAIEANPNRVAKISLPLAGRVAEVLVKTGDSVHKNQPLFTLQAPDGDAAMSGYVAAQTALTQAQTSAAKAQADDDRANDLLAHDAIAKKDALAADTELVQATAVVTQAQAALEQASRRLSVLGLEPGSFDQRVTVRSPLDGKVLAMSLVPGEFKTDTSESVMTVADLGTVWVTSQVPETYIRFVQIGERVDIALAAYPGETFEGKVSRISDTVEPATRTVKVQAEMDNRGGRLRPDMSGSIHHVESMADVITLPAGAVLQSGDESVVFVETAPGHFERRTIAVGRRVDDNVRVPRGLNAGDRVVVDGAMLLQGLLKRS